MDYITDTFGLENNKVGGNMHEKYKIKKTLILIKKLYPYWQELCSLESEHSKKVNILEKKMRNETGIDDIEFFYNDLRECTGIGNVSRTMELIHDEELEMKKIIRI